MLFDEQQVHHEATTFSWFAFYDHCYIIHEMDVLTDGHK